MSVLRTTTLYILLSHLISQQWNLGLCAHEMKASSESIDFYCLLDCRSLPQKLAAQRQAGETKTIWTVSHWKAQRQMFAFAATMLWSLKKKSLLTSAGRAQLSLLLFNRYEVTQSDLPAFGNINIKAGCNQVILVSFAQQMTMLCVVWCSCYRRSSSDKNNCD